MKGQTAAEGETTPPDSETIPPDSETIPPDSETTPSGGERPPGGAAGDGAVGREIQRRRTFAIISHPDAGKTTLTEKLLLYGGAIHLAGTVKARRASRHATSDWMEVERERGISVTSSVLQFDYRGYRLNLLDTPGHHDFSEDTYRTLMAADSAVMLLDNRKGVEEQTRKLFEVCKLRRLPIFTFVNKCDRPGVEPLQLLDDVERDLGLPCAPLTWPVLEGGVCLGIYDRDTGRLRRFHRRGDHGEKRALEESCALESPEAEALFPAAALERLREEVALLDVLGAMPEMEPVRKGEVSPTFFGSALLNFGVESFLERFLAQAPAPPAREAGDRLVRPEDPDFSGFVFKVQANMDPNHRDRVAFVRICSGRYAPGMKVTNLRTGQEVRLAAARRFMARERERVEEAFPGDVVGVQDRGNLRIGDTLSGDERARFDDIPRFSPEHFARVRLEDPLRRKHLDRALHQLSEEGVIQLFRLMDSHDPGPVVGAVGALQLEVLLHRLAGEYGVEARLEPLPYRHARWVTGPEEGVRRANGGFQRTAARDHRERPILLFESEFALRKAAEEAPDGVELHAVSP